MKKKKLQYSSHVDIKQHEMDDSAINMEVDA